MDKKEIYILTLIDEDAYSLEEGTAISAFTTQEEATNAFTSWLKDMGYSIKEDGDWFDELEEELINNGKVSDSEAGISAMLTKVELGKVVFP